MDKIQFIIKFCDLYEELEEDDFIDLPINGDVKRLYEHCRQYLQEKRIISEGEQNGASRERNREDTGNRE